MSDLEAPYKYYGFYLNDQVNINELGDAHVFVHKNDYEKAQAEIEKYSKDLFTCEAANDRLKAEIAELKASNKEYHDYLRAYVQKLASENVQYYGLHLADALVQDHKLLKEENEALKAKLDRRLYQIDQHNKMSVVSCENCKTLNLELDELKEHSDGQAESIQELLGENEAIKAKLDIAVEALKKISGNSSQFTKENCFDFHKRIAKEALAKIGEGEK